MNLTVNGKSATIEAQGNVSVLQLLDLLNVSQKEYVTVELNGDILDRESFAASPVQDGDTVEFLYFMGGGAL
ncbi:sulfur carrier protein ThiS [Geomesophilobacter sediminis]|uniref:Sulfur carrier protein ThiS n=1 Tax=Geomesophilobacter sediminis TaxID=2798584 RepID=A0A8J7J5E5_9BACT|nr:sulfur carrier protein ThiS [Geomesophilobacter sediminis]MBJ6723641.1 sulfur carrier protein ThiS [Geomesophilobacter sediminis]